MRAFALTGKQRIEEQFLADPPPPGPGEVLVRVKAVGICGSDMHWYNEGGIGPLQAVYPQVLGHEPAGEVIAVGKGVRHRKEGDRVSIEPSLTCGHCEYCLQGQHNNCLHCVFLGSPAAWGFFREFALIPEHNTDLVPDNLTWTQATLIEPLAVIVHALELVTIRLGDTVAILGAGPIGMLCAAMAKLAGASEVFICDKLPHRLALAQKMGATHAVAVHHMYELVMDHTQGRGVDLAIDCAAAAETINLSLQLTRPSGVFLLIGIPSEPTLAVDLFPAMNKEIKWQMLKRSNHKGSAAAKLLAQNRIPDALITHVLPFDQTPRGFQMLAHYSDNVGKVVIQVSA
ncbi:MAG: alcohol dehydrogenase catalytic domain-containing protein [Bryobacteraceae bacterium]|nr:alcohol dehydrogenase catalytic domain-containing protein [Bryobacteraceae bacterium]MDW8378397.1 alcohol dehydrogenase catalytic domain-containing protein [Bryobacterales bacterium]